MSLINAKEESTINGDVVQKIVSTGPHIGPRVTLNRNDSDRMTGKHIPKAGKALCMEACVRLLEYVLIRITSGMTHNSGSARCTVLDHGSGIAHALARVEGMEP